MRQHVPGRQLLRGGEMRDARLQRELRERRAVLRKYVLRRRAVVLRGFCWAGLRLAQLLGAVARAGSGAARRRPIPFEELSDQQTRNLRRRGCGNDGAGLAKILLLELSNSLEVCA
jgi:hypothetical protein